MTGTPRETASFTAPVTLPASELESSTAEAPSFTAWAMRWAWIWPSSWGGVSQTTSTGTLCFSESSLAAASAPVRAERKTGFVELLAIIAILRPDERVAGAGPSPFEQAKARAAREANAKAAFFIDGLLRGLFTPPRRARGVARSCDPTTGR